MVWNLRICTTDSTIPLKWILNTSHTHKADVFLRKINVDPFRESWRYFYFINVWLFIRSNVVVDSMQCFDNYFSCLWNCTKIMANSFVIGKYMKWLMSSPSHMVVYVRTSCSPIYLHLCRNSIWIVVQYCLNAVWVGRIFILRL